MCVLLSSKNNSRPSNKAKPGHEYTKANVKFAISVLQSDPIKKLDAFAENNKETQGKFTIGDEKACTPHI